MPENGLQTQTKQRCAAKTDQDRLEESFSLSEAMGKKKQVFPSAC
jgi:hypothetical protein